MNIKKIAEKFKNHFGSDCLIVRSPGRVNIIGEHTDYNEGFVLPAAIDKAAYVAIAKRQDNKVCLYAAAFDQSFETTLSNLTTSKLDWPNYILGVIDQIQKAGVQLSGFDLLIDLSDLAKPRLILTPIINTFSFPLFILPAKVPIITLLLH